MPFSVIAPHHPETLKAVYVAGDSMIDEKIYDGDIAIFAPGQLQGNGIYVVSVVSALLIKRVAFDGQAQSVELISANPAYAPRRFFGPDLENLRIIGRVIACVHRV